MNNARKSFIGLIALGAAVAMPLAFAQEAAPPQEPTDPAAAQPQPEQRSLTWADLDVDGDGKLSKDEASRVQSLTQVFDSADADGDGLLTQEEYQQFVASNAPAQPSSDGT